jgi:hemolysin D
MPLYVRYRQVEDALQCTGLWFRELEVSGFLALVRRYGTAFQDSWRERNTNAQTARNAQEKAFLPALLEVMERAPSPFGRVLLWVIISAFGFALFWAIVGKVEIVAVAQGKVIPSGRSKVVQPLEAGTIKRIYVRDGQLVQAGEPLIDLDASLQRADLSKIEEATIATQLQLARHRAMLDALEGKTGTVLRYSGKAPPNTLAAEQAALRAELSDFTAKMGAIDAERVRREAERRSVAELIAKLEATLPIAQARAQDLKKLRQEGYISEHGMLDREQIRIETERDLAFQRSRYQEIEASLAESRQRSVALIAETRRASQSNIVEAENKLTQFREDARKGKRMEQLSRIVAPITGTVQQLAVNTEGGVVTAAQTLMVIVPQSSVPEIEATLENKDIGFVRAGDTVTVKVDTYPYVRFGTLVGEVTSVTQDAIIDQNGAAFFSVRVALKDDAIRANGAVLPIAAGMTVSAEIKTGKRRVISFVLDPVTQVSQESLRER